MTATAPAARHDSSPAQIRGGTRLTFGIYPGGPAGPVGPSGRLIPEDPNKRLAALQELRAAGRPFVLHIFASYGGPGSQSATEQVGRDVARYTASGFDIELVLTYRPAGGTKRENVAGFVEFVRDSLVGLAANKRLVGLQVTNEANVRGAPNAADGAYAGAQDALIRGVIAAKSQARKLRLARVGVGFNWAYASGARETAFWRRLGRHGGPVFRRSVDWVGVDLYPQTWGPKAAGSLAAATRKTVLASLSALRQKYIPLAGLPPRVRLHISENGYPTGPGRTEAMQVTALRTAVSTVYATRSIFGVSDYRWFDLRDADSSSGGFQDQYGLMRDDYTAKPSFGVYRALIATK